MASWRKCTWTTSVVNNETVEAAIVMAESIRRTRSSFHVTAISSLNVAPENRAKLRQHFDMVFLMDETCAPGVPIEGQHGDVLAKVYAFMLMIFDKCVFVSANSLFLENADKLFEQSNHKFRAAVNQNDGIFDMSLFVMEPDKEVYNHIWKSVGYNGKCITDKYLGLWLKNQGPALKTGMMPDGMVATFSVSDGQLLSDKTHAPIINFVGMKNKVGLGSDEATWLCSLNLGKHEQLMVQTWLEIYSSTTYSIPRPCPLTSLVLKKDRFRNEPIAIVGMSCRYPGANSLEQFWNLLFSGSEGIQQPPAFRWTKEQSLRVTEQNRKTQAGFLSTTVDEFDARFFGVSPKEAVYMDPQARLLHEVLWESLENAGINPLTLYGTHTGIFTGSWMNDYKDIVAHSPEKDFFRTYMGNSIGAAAARLSFLLGLTGPSIATESGCSSAIVALDLAVKSLRNGETNLALTGGVNLLLHPFNSDIMEYVISPDGRCKTFDANANGFGRAEGCGVLVLKRMSDALRDRDNIWALIRGSAVSQEGISRSLGTPTVQCEALSMQLALEDANVAPEQVSFVETHGTGTSVGDPMEVAAIAKAYYTPNRSQPLILGSVKTNVGHTESCSGITGIMKAVLSLKNELIPKHLNLETLNPEIFLDSIPAIIPLEPIVWPKVKGNPRICGVSSFGITGTDGHVIIQEAPDYHLQKFTLKMERPTHILTISGKTQEALEDLLKEYTNQFVKMSEKNDTQNDSFANACFTANVGRAAFNHRAFFLATGYQDAIKQLQDKKYLQAETKDGQNPQICFLFTGQGSQYLGMAKVLYDTSPIFRINFDACDRTLKEIYNISLKPIIWESEPNSNTLSKTIYSQTSIFCVEYCLLKLWQSWGIKPDYVLGHSLGEFCAAVAAEIISFQDALKLVAERSRLIDNLPTGSMLVIKAGKQEVDKLMACANVELDYAAVNNPEQTVVAGDTKCVEGFLDYLKGQGVKGIILEATHAFHSKHMDPILEKYREIASSVEYKKGNASIQYVSGMEGRIIENFAEISADYWVRHTREPVNFIEACSALKESGCEHCLEIGPQPVLSSFVMINNSGSSLNCLPSLRKASDDWTTMLTSLGKLHLSGYQVDWKGYDETYIRHKVSLPYHPYYRKSYWVECTSDYSNEIHPLVGHPVKNPSALNIFQNDLVLKWVPYLKDHCIGNRNIMPGAGFAEMCLSAGYCVANGFTETFQQPTRPVKLENFRIDAPLELKEGKSCRLQVLVDLPEASEQKESIAGFRVKIYHQNANDNEETGKWILHATASFSPLASIKEAMSFWKPERIQEIISTAQSVSTESFYKSSEEHGLRFGETFRMLRKFWRVKQENCDKQTDEVVSEVALPQDWNKYLLHPILIDAVFQTGIITQQQYSSLKLKVPIRIGEIIRFPGVEIEPDTTSVYYHVYYDTEKYHLFICTPTWTPIAYITDVELVETSPRTIESVLEQQSSPVPDCWEEVWKPVSIQPFTSAIENLPDIVPLIADLDVSPTPEEDVVLYNQTKSLIYLYILQGLYNLGWSPKLGDTISDIPTFCKQLGIQPQFHKLIRFYFHVISEDAGILQNGNLSKNLKIVKLPPDSQTVAATIIPLLTSLKNSSKTTVVTGIYQRIAAHLPEILKGNESALALLFPQEPELQQFSAESYYLNFPGRPEAWEKGRNMLLPILKASHRVNDKGGIYRILEVGSGTGHFSKLILSGIKDNMDDRFEYYYTDVSQSFFIKAEKELEEFGKNMKYHVFNIEQSPLSQGIPLEYFDIVMGSDVLHATRNLEESLIHLRQTLRPGGALFFSDTIIQARDMTFVFGLLEGYWRFEDFERRPHHCCVNAEGWMDVLEKSGFRGGHVVPAYVGELGVITGVAREDLGIERLLGPEREEEGRKEWVIFAEDEVIEMVTHVAKMLVVSGFKVTILGRGDLVANKRLVNERVAWMGFLEGDVMEKLVAREQVQGVLYGWGMEGKTTDQNLVAKPFLELVKALVEMAKPPQLFLLTNGVRPVHEDYLIKNPSGGTLTGMLKALKNENTDSFVRYVDLEGMDGGGEMEARQVLYELAMCRGAKEQLRVQVAYRGNVRYEPRLVKGSLPSAREEMKLPVSTERYHLVLPETRLLQDLEFEAMEEETVGDTEIEVKIKAYALNFKDVLTVLKPSKEFEGLSQVGIDFAGVVTKAGEGSRYNVGDRVFGANFKEVQLPSHLVIEEQAVLPIDGKMTYCEAATLPAVFLTAYYCLVNVAKLKKEDTVLIHTGSGGVGLAAIQLAKHVGANIITTAGNPRKRGYLRSLGIEHVFHSRDTSYEQEILRVTNGRGVDVVLNSITGPGIKEATLRATATNGRWVEMSKLSTWTVEEVKGFRPDVKYEIIDLTVLDRQVCFKILEEMRKLIDGQGVAPLPFVKFDALGLRQAMQYLQKAKHIGKVVVTMPEVTLEKGQFKTVVPLFNSESSYLITGGLGGIGFEVCKWMLELGATDIILTGRNPPKPETERQLQLLRDKGYNVIVKLGDVGCYKSCQNIIEWINQQQKPLRGVMHCAGVLRDNLYHNQTWSSFEETFGPKVAGTWNLHNLTLSSPLEHFVMYSSIVALLGSPGQANHSGANCFEDAFIHYRHSLGLPGTTINWGQWAQVGCAKDINVSGVLPISVKRMLKGLEKTLRMQKRQICFSEFDSYTSLAVLCPLVKGYLDPRLWKQGSGNGTGNGVNLNADKFWEEMDAVETKPEKMEVMSGYLKKIIKSALRLEPEENVSETANLQELGVDSLMMIELRNSVQALVGNRIELTIGLLKDCNTIRLIAEAVVGRLMDGDSDKEGIPLEPLSKIELFDLLMKDSVLPGDIQVAVEQKENRVKPSQIKSLLVTGATGNLGKYLVKYLARECENVEKIYCLVKWENIEGAKEKLKNAMVSVDLDMDKVECVLGDVTEKNLGIVGDIYDRLCGEVDGIVHCAAKTHPLEHLRVVSDDKKRRTDCRSVNLEGTRNVLRFACKGKVKHVYYPSTLVNGAIMEDIGEQSTLSDNWPDVRLADTITAKKAPGLQTCKWLCELLLDQANQKGIPCKVFRFPWIAGERETGKVGLENMYVLRFLSYLKAGCMPETPIPGNFLPVDLCAELSFSLFLNDVAPCEIFNISHPRPQLELEFVKIAKKLVGNELEVVEMGEFEKRIEKEGSQGSGGLEGHSHSQLVLSQYFTEAMDVAKGYLNSPDTFFTNEKVSRFLRGYGENFPTTMEILEKDLVYLNSNGLLEKMGI